MTRATKAILLVGCLAVCVAAVLADLEHHREIARLKAWQNTPADGTVPVWTDGKIEWRPQFQCVSEIAGGLAEVRFKARGGDGVQCHADDMVAALRQELAR